MHICHEPPPLAALTPGSPLELVALVESMLRKDQTQRPAMRAVVTELEQLKARQGAAGLDAAPVQQAPEGAQRLSGDKLSDSLAQILGPAIEEEGSAAESSAVSAPATQLLGSRPPAADPPLPTTPRQVFPTVVSGGHSLVGMGERLSDTAQPQASWRIVLAAMVGGGLVAAVTWLLIPSHAIGLRTSRPSAPSVMPAALSPAPAAQPAPPPPPELPPRAADKSPPPQLVPPHPATTAPAPPVPKPHKKPLPAKESRPAVDKPAAAPTKPIFEVVD